MPAASEIEIKLEVVPTDVAALRLTSLPRLTAVPPETRRLTSVYFDTPKHALRKHGFSLRLRGGGPGRVQTIKASARGSVGLFDRLEWETDVAGDAPDLAAALATPLGAILRDHGPLAPIFETVVERTTWTFDRGGSTIEVALDEGRIVAGEVASPIAELELELKSGGIIDLFDVIGALAQTHPLRLGVATKSERGYTLLRGKPTGAVKAEPVVLTRRMSAGAAFQAVARGCIRQFRLNEPLVVATRDAEALHQARVGMRRLRSALSLFKPVVTDVALDGLKARLRYVSRQLGEARNLDVTLARQIRPAVEQAGVDAFVAVLERSREDAYDGLIGTLASASFRTLMLDLLCWIEAGPWLASTDPGLCVLRDQPVRRFAAGVLDRRRRKVKRKGRALDTLEPAARHRVRIEAKKLRYAAEFFASLVGRRDRRRYGRFVGAMERFQDVLGDLNDIETGHTIIEELARHVADRADPQREVSGTDLLPAGRVDREPQASTAALVRSAVETHADFTDAKRFWTAWR